MIKRSILSLLKIYQKISRKMPRVCRFYPTCSEYMIGAIDNYGLTKGIILGTKRIIRCNPFNEGGYDPLP